jgi:hypothetical protein
MGGAAESTMGGMAESAMGGAANLETIPRRYGAAQHGLVARRQLLSAGVASHVIERRVRSGRLVRVHRGVYQTGAVAGAYAREMAAVLACGGEYGVSHGSAAADCCCECRVSHPRDGPASPAAPRIAGAPADPGR